MNKQCTSGKSLFRTKSKEVISTSAGIMSTIARRLSCHWHTAKDYIDADPELFQMLQNETKGVLDMAESVVYKSVKDGNTQDAKWLLSKKGKHRGYGGNVDLKHSRRIDVRSMTDEELESIVNYSLKGAQDDRT